MVGDRFPSLVPDSATAEYLVVLGYPFCGYLPVVERVPHRGAHQRRLFDAVHRVGHLDAATIEDRGYDIGDMVVLVANFPARLDPLRPRNDKGIAQTAVVGVALEHAERR